MKYTERAITFTCVDDTLVGVLALPQETSASTGVIVVVGGPQTRVGSHRQFVLLSRALAAAGYPVLRFDYRGMGDSTGKLREFLDVNADIAAAIEALQQNIPHVKKVTLWGLCDAASAILMYCDATHDQRIEGLCLLNPWVRSEASLARTQVKHYYVQRVMQKEFWVKLLRGGVAIKALAGLIRNIHIALRGASRSIQPGSASIRTTAVQKPFQQRMATALTNFAGSLLLLLSEEDYTAKEFLEYAGADATWRNALNHPALRRHEILCADHTFSGNIAREEVENLTIHWLKSQADGGST